MVDEIAVRCGLTYVEISMALKGSFRHGSAQRHPIGAARVSDWTVATPCRFQEMQYLYGLSGEIGGHPTPILATSCGIATPSSRTTGLDTCLCETVV